MSNPVTARKLRNHGGRPGGPPIWRTEYWSVTIWIIVITSIVSVIDMFSLGGISQFGALSLSGVKRLFLWQIFTYQLLHAGPLHLIFNMLWLWMLGPIIEPILGKTRYLMLYIVSGLTGGALFLLCEAYGIGGIDPRAMLVGASASILGVMAAAVCVAPRMPIRFWFPPITIELWVIFLVAILLALLAIRTWSNNAGGEAAHLGGAAAGLIAFTFRKKLGMVRSKKKSKFWNPADPSSNFFRDGT
jgi:membrane associated rhomboid family serine protease